MVEFVKMIGRRPPALAFFGLLIDQELSLVSSKSEFKDLTSTLFLAFPCPK
jgi:hypothetical protein